MTRLTALDVYIDGDSVRLVQAVEKGLKSLEKLEKDATSAGGSTKRALETAGGIQIAGMVDKVTSLGTSVIKTGFGFNAMREQADIAFKTMLGSGEKAKAFLDQLQRFAEKTPFEFQDLTNASQKLMAMGFQAERVIPLMTAVGDAVAAVGGGGAEQIDQVVRALGQIQAKGRLTAEEMNQLTEANAFSWKALAEQIGVSVPKAMDLVSKGAVSSDAAVKAFADNSKKYFGGMMDAQSKTWNGMLSTAKDVASQVSGRVMGPFFELAKQKLDGFLSTTSSPKWEENLNKIELKFYRWAEAIDHAATRLGNLLEKSKSIGDRLGNIKLPGTDVGGLIEMWKKLTLFGAGSSWLVSDPNKPTQNGLDPRKPARFRELENLEAQAARFAQGLELPDDLQDYAAREAAAIAAAKAQKALNDGMEKFVPLAGGAEKKILTLADALQDRLITMAEASELKLSAAAAGQAEAHQFLADRLYSTQEAAFGLEKTIAKLGTAFGSSEDAGNQLIRTMQKEALEKVQAAAGALFGANTQEQAALNLKLAQLDRNMAGFDVNNVKIGHQNDARRKQIENEVAGLEAQKAHQEAMKLDTTVVETLIALRRREADQLANQVEQMREPWNKQREQLTAEANLMSANVRLREAEIEAANKTLLTDAEQAVVARELLDGQRLYSGAIRDGTKDFRDLIYEVGEVTRFLANLRASGAAPTASNAPGNFGLAQRGVPTFTPPPFVNSGGIR